MKDEKMTPKKISWTNPSRSVSVNSSETEELKKQISILENELSSLKSKGNVLVEESKKDEMKVDLPFESPFTEVSTKPKEDNSINEILNSVKEEVKEEPKEELNMPTFDELVKEEEKIDRLSIVINRFNSDIEALTKGKGAKYISLSEKEHNKLLTGKINE